MRVEAYEGQIEELQDRIEELEKRLRDVVRVVSMCELGDEIEDGVATMLMSYLGYTRCERCGGTGQYTGGDPQGWGKCDCINGWRPADESR